MRKIFKNASIVDVVNQRIFEGWFSVKDGVFEFVEEGKYGDDLDGEIVDLKGEQVLPLLIDSHMHIESSMVTPYRFSQAVLKHGTGVVLQDPHEMANLFGLMGVVFMIENSKNQPLKILTAIPSCVPASRRKLETPNSRITVEDVEVLSNFNGVVALGELMDYNGVLDGNDELMEIIEFANRKGLKIEGHCPTLRKMRLSKYLGYGVRSDHTLTNPEKIEEQLRKGMYVMIQMKSLTRENVEYIMSLKDRSRILLVTDDLPPSILLDGHLNLLIDRAISLGWDPLDAMASATLRPAVYLGLDRYGIIAPGKSADFFTVSDLERIVPDEVYVKGERLLNLQFHPTRFREIFDKSIELRKFKKEDFRIDISDGSHEVRVITMNDENSLTDITVERLYFKSGFANLNGKDIVQVNVFRRRNSEPIGGVGFLKGLNLKDGAFATSFSHDNHNIVIVGKDPEQMAKAGNMILKGGMAFVSKDERILLELPIGGILSDEPVEKVGTKMRKIEDALRRNGVSHTNPILFLTVLALTVSPKYKVSDLGLVDTVNAKVMNLFLK
ncbi:MAG TPA: adenine deaminase [Thermotogales bacterium]|nr:adenine deaminase [Thermotogales bacterium]